MTRVSGTLFVPFFLGCLAAATTATGAPLAARIDAGNAAATRLGGTDATGGLDDWALGDGTICAVVSDPSHENDLSPTGGTLVDLGRCGRNDDQFVLFDQLANLSLSRAIPVQTIVAENHTDRARLIARGARAGISIETTYTLRSELPGRLFVGSRVTRTPGGEAFFALGMAFGNVQTLRPFVTSIRSPGRSRGFVGPAFMGRGAGAAAAAAVPADAVALVGENLLEPAVSYGVLVRTARLERASGGDPVPLPTFIIADDIATIVAVFVRPFWLGGVSSLGWLELAQTRLMDLAPGDALNIEAEIVVGERADVASALDQFAEDLPVLRARVDDPAALVHVVRPPTGEPVSVIRPRPDGTLAARVPAGEYTLRVVAADGRETSHAVRVTAAGADAGLLATGAVARVRLPRQGPMRLVFVGVDGTPDPRFGDDRLGFAVLGKDKLKRTAGVRDLPLSGTPADPPTAVVPPGRYRVYATRGPEYDVTQTEVTAVTGETVDLHIEPPPRVLATARQVAADFHVHASRSLDSALPNALRVASYVADGGEVLVSSDHDAITDYGPTIAGMGLDGQVASIVGIEVTSEVRTPKAPYTIGHANAFPMVADPLAYRDGAPANEGRRWRDVLADLRARPGERVVQLNHADYPGVGAHPRGFFTHLGSAGTPFDPTVPLTAEANRVLIEPDPATGIRDIDFDAIEVLNGEVLGGYPALREDWFALLRQGHILTATANSDSHGLGSIVATPRNYVAVADDRIAPFDAPGFVSAVRTGRTYGTTGPLVDVRLGDAGPGDRHTGHDGTLQVRVLAAPWVPVRELRVFVDGHVVERRSIAAPAALSIPLRFAADAFVTIEVEGNPGPTYEAVLPGFTPFAFTNPIFVDADGDGTWTPPGMHDDGTGPQSNSPR
ncbi:CehA/McbA family metallohydrolase [Candidatus Binatia bacterium]|nr:CehA/McbA family metallohydrolase [Candidatus Binatia bacterium]